MKRAKEILLGVTGGISAYKACELVRFLQRDGFNISVVMTKEAANFIKPLTFQTLSSNKVFTDMFEENIEWNPRHITLAKRAALVLIAPVTANFIGKLANGICDDLLSCICLSTEAKIILCPAMNENMYKHKIVQSNLERLKDLGMIVVSPIRGRLACGDIGIGHMAPVEEIVQIVKKRIK